MKAIPTPKGAIANANKSNCHAVTIRFPSVVYPAPLTVVFADVTAVLVVVNRELSKVKNRKAPIKMLTPPTIRYFMSTMFIK